jgi:Fic family protein
MYTPRYSITNKILKYIGIIEACREVVDHAPLLPYYEKEFRKDALVRAVHHGTHIEGNELNLGQAEKIIEGQDVVARERDVQEIINYRNVMEFIGKERKTKDLGQIVDGEWRMANGKGERGDEGNMIDEEFIKTLHRMVIEKILEPGRCGVYRVNQVVVKNSVTGEVTFTPPVAIVVPHQIRELLEFINTADSSEIHPVLKSGVVHYEFVRIHPFVDGNGRVGRALSTYILFQSGYDIRKFFSLEEYFDRNSPLYYESLQGVEKSGGDLTDWLEYFTEGLAIELTKIKEKVERISVDGRLRERLGGKPIMLTDRQLTIIEYVQKTGFLQNSGFKSLFPLVSEDTVLNDLKYLIKHGIIKKQGSTKAAKYVMN